MPGQILWLTDGHRSDLVRERVETERTFTQVVDTASRPRPKRFLALLSFNDNQVGYAALATRGSRVATGQVRIRYDSISDLRPISLSAIESRLPRRLRRHFTPNLSLDGWLPDQTWLSVLDIVSSDTENGAVVRDLQSQLAGVRRSIPSRQLQVLTEERDALGLALQVFEPRLRSALPSVHSITTPDTPFLLAMQSSRWPEDLGIDHDSNRFDGWIPSGTPWLGATTFRSGGRTLTVTNVNRTPIEHVLGVDLLYFHKDYRSFVLVQYKRMNRDERNELYYRPSGSYSHELQRMKDWDLRTRNTPDPSDLLSYRLANDAFFFKVYSNPTGAPPQEGLLPGMYFPLSYWTPLVASPDTRGPRGGVRITYENSGRHLTNTQFAYLVGGGWVGSVPERETMIREVIAQELADRHSVTVAVAREP